MLANQRRILITGASGFIGKALCLRLAEQGYSIVAVGRERSRLPVHPNVECVVVPDLRDIQTLQNLCQGVDSVVHLAARVHQMKEEWQTARRAHREFNVTLTQRLAQAAQMTGVKQFIFLSSIKVNGERTVDRPFAATDRPNPQDAYALSKWQAECALHAICRQPMQLFILRIPLVIGAGVKGNLLELMRWIDKGFPLPFAALNNRRQLLALDNLCEVIQYAIYQQASGCYTLAEKQALSTPQLISELATAMGKKARLLYVPPLLLKLSLSLIAKHAQYERLSSNLEVETKSISNNLNWVPSSTVQQACFQAVSAYLSSK
jgi:nucleoside-diphosphate-sugar epimerase